MTRVISGRIFLTNIYVKMLIIPEYKVGDLICIERFKKDDECAYSLFLFNRTVFKNKITHGKVLIIWKL